MILEGRSGRARPATKEKNAPLPRFFGAPDIGALPQWLALTKELPLTTRSADWTDETVHFNRLLRDGWTPVPSIDDPKKTWEKRQPAGDCTLVRAPALDAWFDTYGGRHVDDYAVQYADGALQSRRDEHLRAG